MIVNVYAYFNKHLLAFGNCNYDDHTPEKVKINLLRDLRAKVLENQYENLRYLDLYCLGTFDDEKGVFVNNKELIIDFSAAIAELEASLKKENKEEN